MIGKRCRHSRLQHDFALGRHKNPRPAGTSCTPDLSCESSEMGQVRARSLSEFEYLYAYSPYHRVAEGTVYPAVLFSVFDADARVPPWHARKTCAALQFATASDRPVLYRREEHVGHAARSQTRAIELDVDAASFQAANLGLELSSHPPEQAP